jgi:hypothetical protein
MSRDVARSELRTRTQQLVDGPLKHIKAAALAAALMPLASIAAAPASAQTCGSAGVCGVVFNDVNNNGIQDGGEQGLDLVKVFVCELCDGTDTIATETSPTGYYEVTVPYGSTNTVSILIPTGLQASPADVGSDTTDSDGVPNGEGLSVATGVYGYPTDFGLYTPAVAQPGTGTPGYWKNHPDAWPVNTITVGGVTYTKAQAIYWLGKVGKDKTTTMFSSLVPALLNVQIGNDNCVANAIAAAQSWMTTYGPVGSNVPGSSDAWSVGEPTHVTLDSYNNGLLCAPHRQ